jgi:deoxyribodipyrimidine photo-lyase
MVEKRSMSTLVWFRQDLRVADNPALSAALEWGAPVVPVFIFAPEEEGVWAPGAASRWWLHQSLARLDADLRRLGSRLIARRAPDSLAELLKLARECDASRVLWNRRYEPAIIERDQSIKAALREAALEVRSYNGALLNEPWEIKNQAGNPFRIFTAYWRHVQSLSEPQVPLATPARLPSPRTWPRSQGIDGWGLLPRVDWTSGLRCAWTPGSTAAHAALKTFLQEAWDCYHTDRDRPDVTGTSRLSPHLHFGEISPREIWHTVRGFALARGRHSSWRGSQFLTELGWREFAHHLLYHFPQSPHRSLSARFESFPWKRNSAALRAWQRGATGYPIVDAGMRQLWVTGWMHNRVRMIAASFLVKDLLQPWTEGAHWFWDTLVDADLANNTLGWQWVAGCGVDAAPYFRIFNPLTQATRFDPEGTYVREWIPELARLPREWIHQPWAASPAVLSDAGVHLGVDYPQRLVDHGQARIEALKALGTLAKS